MRKSIFVFVAMNLAHNLPANAQAPQCYSVHVWYSLTNDSKDNWAVQIARLYENNISFVDENCQPIDINQKLLLSPNQTIKVGMTVETEKGFYATYSFMGVNLGNNFSGAVKLPQGVGACSFLIAPYAPGQMHRLDWKLNNADCYSTDYGTNMHFL
jgi:hypothetical protein